MLSTNSKHDQNQAQPIIHHPKSSFFAPSPQPPSGLPHLVSPRSRILLPRCVGVKYVGKLAPPPMLPLPTHTHLQTSYDEATLSPPHTSTTPPPPKKTSPNHQQPQSLPLTQTQFLLFNKKNEHPPRSKQNIQGPPKAQSDVRRMAGLFNLFPSSLL